MALIKTYAFGVDFYGGFKASEHTYERFDNPIDAMASYKKSKAHDFMYDDGTFQTTRPIFSYFRYVSEKTDKIGHAYAVTPKRKPTFEDKIEYWLHIDWNPDDEEIMI